MNTIPLLRDSTNLLFTVIHILEDMKVEVEVDSNKSLEISNSITSTCQLKVSQMIEANTTLNPYDAIDAFVSCAQPLTANETEEVKGFYLCRFQSY